VRAFAKSYAIMAVMGSPPQKMPGPFRLFLSGSGLVSPFSVNALIPRISIGKYTNLLQPFLNPSRLKRGVK
jgi:hypothetical protein